jgi:hypothetical protein
MVKPDQYYKLIDGARVERAKELLEIKRIFAGLKTVDPALVSSKAAVVLTYANWEGFYNDCTEIYTQFLTKTNRKIKTRDWMLLLSVLNSDLESIKNRHHSMESKTDFIKKLKSRIESKYASIDKSQIQSKSNLNFKRLSESYSLLNFDINKYQPYRIRLDKELVGWRHGVAHGDSPDLTSMDISSHIDFALSMLLLVSDSFQQAISDRT